LLQPNEKNNTRFAHWAPLCSSHCIIFSPSVDPIGRSCWMINQPSTLQIQRMSTPTVRTGL
jgi:hypothetical protein